MQNHSFKVDLGSYVISDSGAKHTLDGTKRLAYQPLERRSRCSHLSILLGLLESRVLAASKAFAQFKPDSMVKSSNQLLSKSQTSKT